MATPKKTNALADRMMRKIPAPTLTSSSVSGSFKEAPEEYPKRLTLDLTEEQHRKFKVYAITKGTSMNKVLRDYIDSL